MTDYVVGDIQGCYSGLRALLKEVNFKPSRDRLFAVGDLVARGEGSLETLEYLFSLQDRFLTVLGNHDLHFLAVSQGIKHAKPSDKLDPLLSSKKLPKLVNWLRSQPLAHLLDKQTLLCHAGLYPHWSLSDAVALGKEVSQQLRSDKWIQLLKDMYGSQPNAWQDGLTGIERHRFIINALTRMRYIQNDIELEFATKTPPDQAPAALKPWFTVHNPSLKARQRIIFGHWAALMGSTQIDRFIALDTGYVWGNALTAINLSTNDLISVTP